MKEMERRNKHSTSIQQAGLFEYNYLRMYERTNNLVVVSHDLLSLY